MLSQSSFQLEVRKEPSVTSSFVLGVLIFLSICVCHGSSSSDGEIGFTNDTIGAAYNYFVLDDSVRPSNFMNSSAVFQCKDDGARCVFQRFDYASIDFGSGQETQNSQGAVWAALKSSVDILSLTTCTADDIITSTMRSGNVSSVGKITNPKCLVVCNANCTCTYNNVNNSNNQSGTSSNECYKLDGPPDTNDITATEPPVANKYDSCPHKLHTEHCTALMTNPAALPSGLEKQYDCYNFCGGVFISSCDLENGSCGQLTCDNATADGTLTGPVQGCTYAEHYKVVSNTGSSSAFLMSVSADMTWFLFLAASSIIGLVV